MDAISKSNKSPAALPRHIGVLLTSLLAVLPSGTSRASSTGASENITVTLLSEQASVRPGTPFTLGIQMTIRDGWHTYWKNPGDAGLPLRIEWKLPGGFSAGPVEWLAPERISTGPETSYGYSREVLLPVRITPPERIDATSIPIEGTFQWLECSDVCLAGSATLDLALPVSQDEPRPGPAAPLFDAARSRMPSPGDRYSLTAEAGPRAVALSFRDPDRLAPDEGYLYVDRPLVVEYSAPQGFESAKGAYRITATPAANATGMPERLTGVLVIASRARSKPPTAILVDVPVKHGDPAPARRAAMRGDAPLAWYAVVFGLLGVGLALLMRRRSRPDRSQPGTGIGGAGV